MTAYRVLSVLLVLGLLLTAAPTPVGAAGHITFDGSPGTAAPPDTLGPYTMQAFPGDPRATFESVTTIPGPTGDLLLSEESSLRRIGNGWATWSHGYTGDVYYVSANSVTITLPPGTLAFYLYAQPSDFGNHAMTVTADGVSSGPVTVTGDSGAAYFGFYSDGAPISAVTVTAAAGAAGFAVGEFGIFAGEVTDAPPFRDVRADVGVVIYGGWSGIPVRAWVGGTERPVLTTAPNHEGHAAVLFSFWPRGGVSWSVSVAPELPAGLDPERWQFELLWIETPAGFSEASAASVTVREGSHHVLHFQLIDTGTTP